MTNGAVKALTATVYLDQGTTAFNQTGTKRINASAARICVKDADLHFTEEGTTPTTTTAGIGTIAGARDIIILDSLEAIVKWKSIAVTASNARIEVVYYR